MAFLETLAPGTRCWRASSAALGSGLSASGDAFACCTWRTSRFGNEGFLPGWTPQAAGDTPTTSARHELTRTRIFMTTVLDNEN